MLMLILFILLLPSSRALSTTFHGISIHSSHPTTSRRIANELTMRKQKASDKHTARMQRGQTTLEPTTQILSSVSFTKNSWKEKKIELRAGGANTNTEKFAIGGRGRARKRLRLYNSLEGYHSVFLGLISEEYRMEVSCGGMHSFEL
jgi:hypothetical protein